MAKIQTTTKAANVNKAANDTPVGASFESYVSKVTDKKQAAALQAAHKAAQAKKEQKPATKKQSVFALVAGTIASIEHKGLKKAIGYHVAKGNIKRTANGLELTPQGAAAWTKERVNNDPEKFNIIAAFVKANGECPKEWKGQPITKVSSSLNFPNMLYWGSFSTSLMRQAFAAIWAK